MPIKIAKCKVCEENMSKFVMNNKLVCLECDDLIFDLEIESDEERETVTKRPSQQPEKTPPKSTITRNS